MAKPKLPKKMNGDATVAPAETASATGLEIEASSTEPTKTTTRKSAKKPTIVRSEPRANLVPINVEEEIRRLAYLLSERRGFEPGHETEDWLMAEREVHQRYHHQSA